MAWSTLLFDYTTKVRNAFLFSKLKPKKIALK
nr:MAG TPA: hypothetical protein [Caudoviricetes sp.]